MATNAEESADLLYAMRAVMVLLGSGIGLEMIGLEEVLFIAFC